MGAARRPPGATLAANAHRQASANPADLRNSHASKQKRYKQAGGGNIDAAVALTMVSQVGRSSAQAAPKLDVGDYKAILNTMAA